VAGYPNGKELVSKQEEPRFFLGPSP